jgi:hypothetical protein
VKISARQGFAAALALYLLWVAALTVLAVTSAARPASARIRPGVVPAPAETPGHSDANPKGGP